MEMGKAVIAQSFFEGGGIRKHNCSSYSFYVLSNGGKIK